MSRSPAQADSGPTRLSWLSPGRAWGRVARCTIGVSRAVASSRRGGGWGAAASPGVAGVQGSRLGWGVGGAGGAPRAELDGPPAPTLPSPAAFPAGRAAAPCSRVLPFESCPGFSPCTCGHSQPPPCPGCDACVGWGRRDGDAGLLCPGGLWKRAMSARDRRSRSPPWLRVPARSHAPGPPRPACTGRPTALLRSRHAA